uniref:Uncharacterized protein n=1 Tax=Globisporangium ultimum (strain ATCC 200006 / CBS 805.95 / DAOM BR144) TaxID=431595 RepID=K3WBG6_GLOUD
MEDSIATKHVRWGAVSVLEFSVGYSACSVPGSAGPPIGLKGLPISHSVIGLAGDNAQDDSEKDAVKRTRQDMWLCPMERAKIVAEEDGLQISEITAICSDVRATLDARAISKFDHLTQHMMQSLEMNRLDDLRKLRDSYHHVNRKKIVLF